MSLDGRPGMLGIDGQSAGSRPVEPGQIRAFLEPVLKKRLPERRRNPGHSNPAGVAHCSGEEPPQIECPHFADCVRTRQQPRMQAEEGIRALQV